MKLLQKALSLGASGAAYLPVEKITFEPSLIDLCRMNTCGNYGNCWTCPPLVGETEQLIEKLKQFDIALVFQCIYPLEDSFDIVGMTAGKEKFQTLTHSIAAYVHSKRSSAFILGAGGCTLCSPCSAQLGTPCPYPDKAIASLESYSIQVRALAQACGLQYINGQNTVTYFGAVFFDSCDIF